MGMTAHRLRIRRGGALVAITLVTSLIAACGASAEGSKSPAQIVKDAANAARSVHSYHLVGSISESGAAAIALDVRSNGAGAMSGSVTISSATAQFIAVNGQLYLQGQQFFTTAVGPQFGLVAGNQWVKAPAAMESSFVSSFSAFTDTTKFADCLASSSVGLSLSAKTTTLNGASVVAVTGGDVILDVADSGTPYPLRATFDGKSGLFSSTAACSPTGSAATNETSLTGSLTFENWGSAFSVAAPTASINLPSAAPAPVATTVVYKDPQGRWTATFAGTPTYKSTMASSPEGTLPYMYAEYSGADVDQLVSVLLIRPGSSYDLAGGFKAIAKALGGTVVSLVADTFRGYRSVEGVFSTGTGFYELRMVAAGAVIYSLGTYGPVNPPADYAAFMAAVKLTPH